MTEAQIQRRRMLVVVRMAMLLVLIGVMVLAAFELAADQGLSMEVFEHTILSWGMWGVVASIGLMVLHSLVPFPAEFLALANGMIYGPVWGTAITWTGAMLGAYLAFGLARLLGRPCIELFVARKNWHVFDDWTAERGGIFLFASRFVPVIAFNLINYAAGLTRVSWWTFTWATGLGILPLTAAMVVMGHQIEYIAWWMWLILFAAGLLLWPLMRLYFRPKANIGEC